MKVLKNYLMSMLLFSFCAFNTIAAPSCKSFLLGTDIDVAMKLVFDALRLIDRAEIALERHIESEGKKSGVIDLELSKELIRMASRLDRENKGISEISGIFRELASILNGTSKISAYSRIGRLLHNGSQN